MCGVAQINHIMKHRAGSGALIVLQKVASEADPKVRNHGEGPY